MEQQQKLPGSTPCPWRGPFRMGSGGAPSFVEPIRRVRLLLVVLPVTQPDIICGADFSPKSISKSRGKKDLGEPKHFSFRPSPCPRRTGRLHGCSFRCFSSSHDLFLFACKEKVANQIVRRVVRRLLSCCPRGPDSQSISRMIQIDLANSRSEDIA